MRVVCWNIEQGHKPNEIIDYLKRLKADIYLLYELDRGVKRTSGVDMFKLIQDGLNFNGRYVTEFVEIDSIWRYIIPWGGPGGGEIGNAIFSRYPLEDYRAINLPVNKPLTYERTTLVPELFQPRKGCRKAQLFSVKVNGVKVHIASAHLELWHSSWAHRKRQLEHIMKHEKSKHSLLAGDFNSVGGALQTTLKINTDRSEVKKVRSFLSEHQLTDPFSDLQDTSGRLGIRAKLDWMAATKDIEPLKATVKTTTLSDHSCLIVDYKIVSST